MDHSMGNQRTMGGRPSTDEVSLGDGATVRPGVAVLGRIDRYELVRELGGGGFGVVYLARDAVAGVLVAVKGLPPMVRNNAEELERIRSNFVMVSRLYHPNIAPALVLHQVAEVVYGDDHIRQALRVLSGDYLMVMAYAPGVTLSKWRRQFPLAKVPVAQALEVCRQIASALDYAHGERIIHRDIKPGNVMVETCSDGSVRCRVLDFGLAAEIRSSMCRVSQERGDTSGTRPYMAPEQWTGAKQDANTDQYSLAVLFYELVNGEVPFAGVFDTGDPVIMMTAVEKRPPEPVAELTRAQNAALLRGLAKESAHRFPNCAAFVAALSGKGSGLGVSGSGKGMRVAFGLAGAAVVVAASILTVMSVLPSRVRRAAVVEQAVQDAAQRENSTKAAEEKTIENKAALEKAATDQAVVEKMAADKVAADKAAADKAAADKTAAESAAREQAQRLEVERLASEKLAAEKQAMEKKRADEEKSRLAADQAQAAQTRDEFEKEIGALNVQAMDRSQGFGSELDKLAQTKKEAESFFVQSDWKRAVNAYEDGVATCRSLTAREKVRQSCLAARDKMRQAKDLAEKTGGMKQAPSQWKDALDAESGANTAFEKGDFDVASASLERARLAFVGAGEVAKGIQVALDKAKSEAVSSTVPGSVTTAPKGVSLADGKWLASGSNAYALSRKERFPLLIAVYATGIDKAATDSVLKMMEDAKISDFAKGWLPLIKEDLASVGTLSDEEKQFARQLTQNNTFDTFPVILILNGSYQADFSFNASDLKGGADAFVESLRKIKGKLLQ